jgi:Domain of unknown function (DUF6487)
MVDKDQKSFGTCPYCDKELEVGCLMGKDSLFGFQWYEGEPTFWRNVYPHGDPIGEMGASAGLYLKGFSCMSCRRLILEY